MLLVWDFFFLNSSYLLFLEDSGGLGLLMLSFDCHLALLSRLDD